MRKHRLGKQLLIVFCVVLIVFLAGCRPSPVLEQIIYEQNHQVDPDTETKTMNDDLENEEPDENIPSRETVDDSEQTKGESHTAALAGDTDTSDDTDAVYDVAYSPYGELSEPDETNPTEGSASETATGSTEAGGDEGGYAPSGEGEASDGAGDFGENSGDGTDAGEEQTDGGNGELDGEPDTGDGYNPTPESTDESRQIVDALGRTVNLPQNVDTVTAVGEVATIVEMLGGSGRLVGSSSSFTGSSWVQTTFDLNGVNTWWEGNGSTACVYFDALLAAHPDVCFEISGQNTFSDGQHTALDEAGIAYVVLPKFSSIEGIESTVTLVGQVLGDRTADYGVNSEGIASSYCSWADNTINQVTGRSYSMKATTFIGRWDYDASWRVANTARTLGEGKGAPVSMAYSGVSPLNDCMTDAGLINTASDNYYVEPVIRGTYEPTIIGEARFPTNYTVHTISSEELGVGLGTVEYPAIIVEDSVTRDNIVNDDNYFRCHWLEGTFMYFDNSTGYGAEDGYGGFIRTEIQNDIPYRILVNPSGVGNWAEGSVESPMEAVWLANEFQDCDFDLAGMIRDFYNEFYHVNVDTSNILTEDWTYPYWSSSYY